jgi:Tubulin-tyrosine ligase family
LNFVYFLSTQSIVEDYFSETGTVAEDIVTFAIARIEEAIKKDEMLESEASEISPAIWDTRLLQFQDVSRGKATIGPATVEDTKKLLNAVKKTAAKAIKVWPWLPKDGVCNIWIVKPMYQSCGRGITLHNTEKSILTLVEKRKFKYIAQKYMGR